jgi:hypothetical protein
VKLFIDMIQDFDYTKHLQCASRIPTPLPSCYIPFFLLRLLLLSLHTGAFLSFLPTLYLLTLCHSWFLHRIFICTCLSSFHPISLQNIRSPISNARQYCRHRPSGMILPADPFTSWLIYEQMVLVLAQFGAHMIPSRDATSK